MDQQKTGRFIAAVRKDRGLTQRQLADTLGISDKTVSKWECGNGLPEVGLMLPLCEALSIGVNELLAGERLSDAAYRKKAEETIMELMLERKRSKRVILLSVAVCALTILSGVTIVLLTGTLEMQTWTRILLIGIASVVLFGGIAVAVALDYEAGTFECPHCKARFVPTLGAYIAGPHTLLKRSLTCPVCGKRSCCRRRLTH